MSHVAPQTRLRRSLEWAPAISARPTRKQTRPPRRASAIQAVSSARVEAVPCLFPIESQITWTTVCTTKLAVRAYSAVSRLKSPCSCSSRLRAVPGRFRMHDKWRDVRCDRRQTWLLALVQHVQDATALLGAAILRRYTRRAQPDLIVADHRRRRAS